MINCGKKEKVKGFNPFDCIYLLSLPQHKECYCKQACNCEDCLKARLFLRCCWRCCSSCCSCLCWWHRWCHCHCCCTISCDSYSGCSHCCSSCCSCCISCGKDLILCHWIEPYITVFTVCNSEFHGTCQINNAIFG